MKKKQINDAEREYLIDEISKMPPMVIATAYLHALNYTLYGADVTKAWTTAVQQQAMLSKARERGYYEALSHSNIGKDVLDKIELEIKAMFPPSGSWMYDEGHEVEHTVCEVLVDVLQIIDKYRNEVSE